MKLVDPLKVDRNFQVSVRKSVFPCSGGLVGVAVPGEGKLRGPGYESEHTKAAGHTDPLVQLKRKLPLRLQSWRFRFQAGVVVYVVEGVIQLLLAVVGI